MRIFNGCVFLANPSSYVRQEKAAKGQSHPMGCRRCVGIREKFREANTKMLGRITRGDPRSARLTTPPTAHNTCNLLCATRLFSGARPDSAVGPANWLGLTPPAFPLLFCGHPCALSTSRPLKPALTSKPGLPFSPPTLVPEFYLLLRQIHPRFSFLLLPFARSFLFPPRA